MKRKRKAQRLKAIPQAECDEAEELHRHIVLAEEVGQKVVRRFAIGCPSAWYDYGTIATLLAAGDPATRGGPSDWPQEPVSKRYAHHFEKREASRHFFSQIDLIARRYLGDMIYCQADAAGRGEMPSVPDLLWDDSILPRQLAPHILRQWTIDSSQFRRFLIALFAQFARFHAKGSTGRRAILIAQGVSKVGWKPLAHTEKLIRTGDIKLGHFENPADEKIAVKQQSDTVGKSIRRMRIELRRRASAS